jgi:hypothetical protein
MGEQVVNLIIVPTREVERGKYNVVIGVEVEGREQVFQQNIMINVKTTPWKSIMLYAGFSLLGLLLLALILLAARKKEERDMRKERISRTSIKFD